jgi:hypothetical protein
VSVSDDRREAARQVIEDLTLSFEKTISPIRNQLVTKEVSTRWKPTNVKRSADGRIIGYGLSRTLTMKPSSYLLSVWMSKEYVTTEKFRESCQKLSSILGLQADLPQQAIVRFLEASSIDKNTSLEVVIDDLEGRPIRWDATAELFGVDVDSTLQLSNGVTIRRLEESDLEYEEPTFGSWIGKKSPIRDPLPESILNLSISTLNPTEVQRRVELTCILLSLYGETCATFESYKLRATSFLQLSGGEFSHNQRVSMTPSIRIESKQISDLNHFMEYFEPRLPQSIPWGRAVDPLEIALRRYLDSIKGGLAPEDQLLRAVMGLEALYLAENTELRFKLALRVSQLMRFLKEDSLRVSEVVSNAYKYRSSFVHGSGWSDNDRANANETLKLVWHYLRKSILFWLAQGISSSEKKSELLKEIDDSLIGDTKLNTLRGKCDAARILMRSAI